MPEVAQVLSFYPRGRNWAYFHSTGSGFRDTGRFSKLPYLGMKLAIGQSSRSCTYRVYFLSTPMGAKFSLFSLYGQQFLRYWPIFKIAIFGHETWPLAKVPEVAHIIPFHPRGGRNWAHFSSMGSGSEIRAHFQNCHIWAWNLAIGQSARSCTYTLFLP